MSSFPVTRRQAITVVLGLAVVLLLGARWLDRSAETSAPAAAPCAFARDPPSGPSSSLTSPARCVAPVSTASLTGLRVADAIERAGGATPKALVEALNLAAPLADGQQVLVPRKVAGALPPRAARRQLAGPVSLSAATLDQLDTLPGVGPVTAQKILDYRDGARRVPVRRGARCGRRIGPATIEELRERVVP